MDNRTSIGSAFALIGKEPVKLKISIVRFSPTNFDPNLHVPFIYEISVVGTKHISDQQRLYVRVHDEVTYEVPPVRSKLHRYALRFAVMSLRSNRRIKEITLGISEFNSVREEGRLQGSLLGETILRYIYFINSEYPAQAISWPDIVENYNADENEVQEWLQFWSDSESIKKARVNRIYEREGFSTTPYVLNPARAIEVAQKIGLSVGSTINLDSSYRHYRIIPIEADKIENGFVFYMTEFRGESLRLFEETVKPYCKSEAKLDVLISKEDRLPNKIDDKVISHIHNCRFAIADITTRNPNVLYELGFAHAIGKDVIIICRKNDNKEVFDIRNIDTIYFSNEDDLLPKLKDKLEALNS
jgi:hypothetical protein